MMERRRFLQTAAGGAIALANGASAFAHLSGAGQRSPDSSPAHVDGAAESTVRPVNALTPPMGWNSWDCFGASVREDEVKTNADYMAAHLRRFGWEYIVVDIQWYEPTANGSNYHAFAHLDLDANGRPIPSSNRFPSAQNGQGFAPLAAYCHDRKLRFGIHVLRGIPRQAVKERLPIAGTAYTADQVADTKSVCQWNTDMYGVDAARPGAQAWYDSLITQYRQWGVDFIKVDDLSRPYHKAEIEMIHSAITRLSPNIVFSTSPGDTPVAEAAHIETHANMWRISDDFWDKWDLLRHNFDLCARWQGHADAGHWPDADMLPLGHIGIRSTENGHGDRRTLFTRDEQTTMLTLWCMARSPLMFGGHLPDNDAWTLNLITNTEVLDAQKHSRSNRQLSRDDDKVIWTADGTRKAKYAALFNLGDTPRPVTVTLSDLGFAGSCHVRDLWQKQNLPVARDAVTLTVPAHGAQMLRLTPA